MAILILEDLKGTVEVLVFPRSFKETGKNISEDAIVFIKGSINLREDTPKIIADEILPLDEARKKYIQALSIRLYATGLEKKTLQQLNEILKKYKGNIPVYLDFTTKEKHQLQLSTGKDISVLPTDELIEEVEALLGQGSIRIWV